MIRLLLDAEVFAPEPLGQCTVAVWGSKILWVGDSTWPEIPGGPAVERVHLDSLRLVPGLIDGHVHVTGGGGESGPSSRVPPLGLSEFTRHGITTVVGLLGTDDLTRTPASLVTAVRGLAEQGLTAYCYTGGYHLPPATITGSVRGDIVFVDPVIGLGELAISDHRSSQPTLDELLRLASETHVAGLMTGKAGIVHLHLGDGPRGLDLVRRALEGSELPPRTFHPTHVNRRQALFEEALELARRGVTIDVTAFPEDAASTAPDELAAAAAIEAFLETDLPRERLTVSSDGGGCLPAFDADGGLRAMDVARPGALLECLVRLLARGRTPEEVLPMFTSNVAQLLRLPAKGRIDVGADADLIALDADGAVRYAMARGVWHVKAGAPVRFGPFEHRPEEAS